MTRKKRSLMLKDQLKTFLQSYKHKTIPLDTLQQQISGEMDYVLFARVVLELEAEGVLKRIKVAKENGKTISLGNKYTVYGQQLNTDYRRELKGLQFELDPQISLEAYYHMKDIQKITFDLPYIKRIDAYLKNSTPKNAVKLTFPKLSYELVQDEKWLQEKGGIALLKRIKLWANLEAILRFEPLVFAQDPEKLQRPIQHHLILENKTPFIDAMDGLKESPFTTLIYGAGWQIVSSIQQFKQQIGTNCQDCFHYFGDLDREGIHIWNSLIGLCEVTLARSFYETLLQKPPSKGKENQSRHLVSEMAFLAHFNTEQQDQMKEQLSHEGYWPQEALSKEALVRLLHDYLLKK